MAAKRHPTKEPLIALDEGIAEADRRPRGDFDGLIGNIGSSYPALIKDLLDMLRDFLLRSYSEQKVRALLDEYLPRPGYANLTPIPDDIELALALFNAIASALRCEQGKRDRLLLGPRDAKRQRGARKGGDQRWKTAPKWHASCLEKAQKLLDRGMQPRNLVGKLGHEFNKNPSTIRRLLQTRDVLKKKCAS